MSRLISFAVLIVIIIIISLLFYKVLIGFFIPVFLAAVLVVVFRPMHRWVLDKTGQRGRLAAALTTLLIMLVLFIPVLFVGSAAATQGLRLIKESKDASTIQLRLKRLRDSLGLEMPDFYDKLQLLEEEIARVVDQTGRESRGDDNERLIALGQQTVTTLQELRQVVRERDGSKWEEDFDEIIAVANSVGQPDDSLFGASDTAVKLKSQFGQLRTELLGGGLMALAREKANPTREDIDRIRDDLVAYVQPRLLSLTGATGSFVIKLVVASIILTVTTYFFLYDGPSMVRTIMHLSPLDDAYEEELLLEFDRISRAVVVATLLSAIVQGLTAGLGYAVAGMEFLTLLIMLTTVFAMVPFVGPAVVWVPVCLYLGIYEERMTAAVLLGLWGVLVVGTVDNLVKAFVLHGQSQLHPLLALLSVLGGVQSLGPIGIVVGPMVVAMLQTLLSILRRELVHFEKHKLVLSTEGPSESTAHENKSAGDPTTPDTASADHPKQSDSAAPSSQQDNTGTTDRTGKSGDGQASNLAAPQRDEDA